MERLQRLFGSATAGLGQVGVIKKKGQITNNSNIILQGMQPGMDTPTVDNAEMVYISSLALLKVN